MHKDIETLIHKHLQNYLDNRNKSIKKLQAKIIKGIENGSTDLTLFSIILDDISPAAIANEIVTEALMRSDRTQYGNFRQDLFADIANLQGKRVVTIPNKDKRAGDHIFHDDDGDYLIEFKNSEYWGNSSSIEKTNEKLLKTAEELNCRPIIVCVNASSKRFVTRDIEHIHGQEAYIFYCFSKQLEKIGFDSFPKHSFLKEYVDLKREFREATLAKVKEVI